MKKAYLAISYSKRSKFDAEVDFMTKLLKLNDIDLLVFVDKYNFNPDQENEMMKRAFEEIDDSDIFIAELSNKSIGVGIELGYAFAKQKPIIYLRRKDSSYSTTSAGCSRYIIDYECLDDLGINLELALKQEFASK